jgi:Tol biopolymer transport system component
MTAPRDPDRLVRALLDEGPTVLSDRAVESVLGEVHRTHQRAVFGLWRTLPMSRTAFATAAAIAVVAIGGLAFWATRPTAPAIGQQPSSLPLPVASTSPTPAGPSPSSGSQAGGTIVFGFHDTAADADYLYAIAPDGTGKRKLTNVDSCCLTLSPDGRTALYGQTGPDGRVTPTVSGIDGSGRSRWDLPAGLNLAPSGWSTKFDLAFEGWDDKNPSRNGIYLSIDNGGGLIWGTLKRLTTSPRDHHDIPLGFSPDGSELLFLRNNAGDHVGPLGDLFVIGIDGSALRQLNPATAKVRSIDLFGVGASWSPDGRQVAFSAFDTSRTDGSSTVYVVSAEAGAAKAIAEPDIWTTSARWSPDGAWIAFDRATGSGGIHDVWLVHPDGSGLTNITSSIDEGVGVCCSQWSPDGSKLLIQGGANPDSSMVDLWIVNADGTGGSKLTAQPGGYKWYAWGPEHG